MEAVESSVSGKKSKAGQRRNKSLIWDHCKVSVDGEYILCTIQECKQKWRKCYGTSNAMVHLLNVHKITVKDREPSDTSSEEEVDVLEPVEATQNQSSTSLENNVASNSSSIKSMCSPPPAKTSTFKSKHASTQQKSLVSLLLIFIVKNMQPFALCNDKSFLNFCYALDPKFVLPDRKTVANLLRTEYETRCGGI